MNTKELFKSAITAKLNHREFLDWAKEHSFEGTVNKCIVWDCAEAALDDVFKIIYQRGE